jgi:two-component system sensor histidine kinase RegB
MIVDLYFHMVYPRQLAWSIIALSMAVNLILTISQKRRISIPSHHTHLYLIYDLGQLGALLFVTGGLNNPFVVMMLAPVVVAASFLPLRQAILVTSAGLVWGSLLYISPYQLPWFQMGLYLPEHLRISVLFALWISMIFIATYLGRLSADRHKMEQALQATELALVREQKLASLGGLAAAAAHELGSPLTTIMLVVKELQTHIHDDFKPDVDLLAQEVARCRDILQDLSLNFSKEHTAPYQSLPLEVAMDVIVQRCNNSRKKEIHIQGRGGQIKLTAEFTHAMMNIINNAIQFASKTVTIDVSDRHICVSDDGPGYSDDVVHRLGQPYVSGRLDDKNEIHMGLGLFIAQRLLEKCGAVVYFYNDKGAVCDVKLQSS